MNGLDVWRALYNLPDAFSSTPSLNPHRKYNGGCQRVGESGMGSYCLISIEFPFFKMKRVM